MYKLFQECTTAEHIRTLNPTLTPLDNRNNPFPELREYHCFGMLLNSNLSNGLDMWGMLTPNWSSKLKYPISQITTALDSNPNLDVYIFNHARVTDVLTVNVWENSEQDYPGISKIMQRVLKLAGYDTTVLTAPMYKTTCYGNYFVATRKFWDEYLSFITTIKQLLDTGLVGEDHAMYMREKSTLFLYIVERLLSTFLMLKNYNIYKHPYDFSVYKFEEKEKNFYVKLFNSLSKMKEYALTENSEEFYNCWDSFRQVTNMQFPSIKDLDE